MSHVRIDFSRCPQTIHTVAKNLDRQRNLPPPPLGAAKVPADQPDSGGSRNSTSRPPPSRLRSDNSPPRTIES
jgi:hypothetical protein